MINGSTQGIRASILAQMETLYEIQTDRDEFVSQALLTAMAAFTGILQREIAVYLDRTGDVVDVSVGDSTTVPLQNLRVRRSQSRLCGLRCIHTHPGGDATLSAVDLQSLQKLRLDAMAALGVKDGGQASALMPAFLIPDANGVPAPVCEAPRGIYQIPQREWMARIYDSDELIGKTAEQQDETERAILVALEDAQSESVRELASLAKTAGVAVCGVVTQKSAGIDPATYIGKGKAQELSLTAQALDADVCIFNDELSGAQIRNLENEVGCRIIDRTTLILDIFAQRAQSREGKLQVELAQLRYNSSRLTGLGIAMSRLGGGIGTRGPGETKLETDRRHIRSRIGEIEREIAAIDKNRSVRRARRERNEVPVCALVGYTNAGKSTLLNALSGADVLCRTRFSPRWIPRPGASSCRTTAPAFWSIPSGLSANCPMRWWTPLSPLWRKRCTPTCF
jgi:GTP-binding protein HflX